MSSSRWRQNHMTLSQAERWLSIAGSQSVLLWQTTTWSKFLRSRCQTLNEPRMILHTQSLWLLSQGNNHLSCMTYCQYFRWRILTVCFLLACDLLTSSGHGWWKQLPLCENQIKWEISTMFTKLNKLFFFLLRYLLPLVWSPYWRSEVPVWTTQLCLPARSSKPSEPLLRDASASESLMTATSMVSCLFIPFYLCTQCIFSPQRK